MRYLPLTDDRPPRHAGDDRRALGRRALFRDVPETARLTQAGRPAAAQGRAGGRARDLRALAAKNLGTGSAPSFLGAGAYRHHVPASVDHLIQRGEFLTSYTPYQPEVTQGTLQYLFEFQTQVALLTGMDVANASMYDGATATGRGGDDGQPRHPPQHGGALRRPASALPRGDRDPRAVHRLRGRRRAGRSRGRGRPRPG